MKLKMNDEVIVTAGKAKGTKGKIVKIHPKSQRVVVQNVNIVKKHNKPTQQDPDGGIKEFEAPIHVSNVAFVTKGKDGVPTRIGYKIESNKKMRVAKKTGKEL